MRMGLETPSYNDMTNPRDITIQDLIEAEEVGWLRVWLRWVHTRIYILHKFTGTFHFGFGPWITKKLCNARL